MATYGKLGVNKILVVASRQRERSKGGSPASLPSFDVITKDLTPKFDPKILMTPSFPQIAMLIS